tara:strand:- start:736 stop:2007 length:1272 start_codon:yes stop_codon:yes gene_type:complete
LIGLISINYKISPVEVREKFYFEDKEKIDFYEFVSKQFPIDGIVILSTCNRTEIYYEYENHLGQEKRIFHVIMKCLVEYKHYSEGLSPYAIKKTGSIDVSKHLFRLISGLESMVVGEFQIVDQLKEAFYFSKKKKILGPILSRIFQKSFETGKDVRSNTKISEGAVSVSYAAVEIISKKYDLKKSSILCVGTGETSKLSIKHLLKKKIKNIVLTNRTDKKAESFANSYDLDFVSFKNYKKCFSKIDIAIFSTSSSSPLISFSEVSDLMKKRKNKKLLLVDLSIPRNIEGNISSISGVDLVSIDGLKDLVNKNYKKRKSETEKAKKIIDNHISDFDSWISSRQLRTSILSIKKQVKKLIEINSYPKKTNGIAVSNNGKSPKEKSNFDKIHSKLSDHLVRRIRIASNDGKDKNALNIIKKIFDEN